LSPALSTVSVPGKHDDSSNNATGANGTSANRPSSNGDETLSPSKTLKLTLKVAKSPVRPEEREGQETHADMTAQDEDETENDTQHIEFRKQPPTPTPAASATLPNSASHHRKPSIFGTATVEEDEQQDEADLEDGELSDVGDGDEPAEKDEQENADDNMVAAEEEMIDESEAEEVETSGMCYLLFLGWIGLIAHI
jgi:hypothetical protein